MRIRKQVFKKHHFYRQGKALSINMSNREIDMLSLVTRLEKILSALDENGYSIAAIKVEEAINALERAQEAEQQNGENS